MQLRCSMYSDYEATDKIYLQILSTEFNNRALEGDLHYTDVDIGVLVTCCNSTTCKNGADEIKKYQDWERCSHCKQCIGDIIRVCNVSKYDLSFSC